MFAQSLPRALRERARGASRAALWLIVLSGLPLASCADLTTNSYGGAPVITTQPVSQHVAMGDRATFTVVATGDSLTYQWYKGGGALSGATSATLTIASVAPSDAGTYQVVVSNAVAPIASDTAFLDVIIPASIVGYRQIGGIASSTNQPYSSVTADGSAVFVSGGGDLTLINATITKSGSATSLAASQQVGTNAALLVDGGAKVTLAGGSVWADSAGASGLFATGGGSSIAMYRGAVVTTGASSYGVAASLGGSIQLDKTTIRASAGTLVSATGASVVTFLADADSLAGNLIADASSTISATLQNGARLSGAVQGAALQLDSTSTWNVTAPSALTSLSDAGGISGTVITNIIGNGFTVYYSASLPASSALGGKTYDLLGGGVLVPR